MCFWRLHEIQNGNSVEGTPEQGKQKQITLATWADLQGSPDFRILLSVMGFGTLGLTWAEGCWRISRGEIKSDILFFFFFFETEWLGSLCFISAWKQASVSLQIVFHVVSVALCVAKHHCRQQAYFWPHYCANNTSQLSPSPHKKGLILFHSQSKLLKALGFIQGLHND